MIVHTNVSLSAHTTFRIGGVVSYLLVIESLESAEFVQVVEFAESKKLPMFVLGGGSNLLVSDEPLNIIVLKIAPQKKVEYAERENDVLCVAGGGESWDEVVADAVAHNYGGIENLSLIPGTVGAAPVQNIGAYGVELADVLEWVEVFDVREKKMRVLSVAECELGYRSSIFKKSEGKKYIVTRVAMRLSRGASPNISYKDLATHFQPRVLSEGFVPAISDVRDVVMAIRRVKLPDPATTPNAGSFFKNPVITAAHGKDLAARFPGLPLFPVKESGGEYVKTSAAWIIDHVCGLRGAIRGSVGTFETQPLVIINRGDATAKDVATFSDEIISAVKEKTNIILEPEVEFISARTFSKK